MATVDLGFSGEMRVVDVETTGLYPYATNRDPSEHHIISVCVMPIYFRDGVSDTFGEPKTWVVNPGRPIPPAASRVNGFRDRDVKGMPAFADVAGEVRDAIGEHPLVGHNVAFDKRFLTAEFKRAGVKGVQRNKSVCTMNAVGTLMHGVGRYSSKWDRLSLDSAISLFSGGTMGRSGRRHSAAEDVEISANLASTLNELAHLPMATLKQLIRNAIEKWPEEAERRVRHGRRSQKKGSGLVTILRLASKWMRYLGRVR